MIAATEGDESSSSGTVAGYDGRPPNDGVGSRVGDRPPNDGVDSKHSGRQSDDGATSRDGDRLPESDTASRDGGATGVSVASNDTIGCIGLVPMAHPSSSSSSVVNLRCQPLRTTLVAERWSSE
ncbi:unnamed protein product [Lactuca saligna]|uniref:Uncharacterized protein n=1 Tax=Lactuca saligna TaxID=75948 RepID=A0AA35VNF8_LACSI|nr:unnamed protein product [Lactuca saligna]